MSLNKRVMWVHGAIVAKSSHLRHVFSGYENQTNIARKWSRVVGRHLRHVFSGYENQTNIARKWSRVVGCHLRHVFSGHENQTDIARKWSRVVDEVSEENPNYGHTRVHDNMVPWALRALGTTRQRLRRWIYSLIYYLSLISSYQRIQKAHQSM